LLRAPKGAVCQIVGGAISPLLANIYLHELDKFMEQHTVFSRHEKTKRRQKQGMANFAYARYADDFVVLCNGTKEEVLKMRETINDFLFTSLRLTLSMEKTKVTHLNDGFDFLGFNLRRSMGQKGMTTKVVISAKAMRRHRDIIRAATAPSTHQDSVAIKILALNRIIAGWCRYYQYTNKLGAQFSKLAHLTYWSCAHWLGRKYQLNMPNVLRQFCTKNTLGTQEAKLIRHTNFKALRYTASPYKPNPYTTQSEIEREELLDVAPWLGTEQRPGTMDLRPIVFERDEGKCRLCHKLVTLATSQMDHVRPVRYFKRPVEANVLSNLWTLCIECHKKKTEYDRQMESRVH
jgi:RNA-directed DNA polymerase